MTRSMAVATTSACLPPRSRGPSGAQRILGSPRLADGVTPGTARMELPPHLKWTLHRGETDPISGWYSGGLGQRIPAFTLIGCGRSGPDVPLITRLEFVDIQALPFGYGRGRCVTTFGREKGGDV